MLALAEAALALRRQRPVSLRVEAKWWIDQGTIDGYLRLAYPVEQTGIGQGSIRMATFGDGSTNYQPDGSLYDTFLINPLSSELRGQALGELEIAYKRYQDPAYAWVSA